MAETLRTRDQLRLNTVTLNRVAWAGWFTTPFRPQSGKNVSPVAVCFAPADFAEFDGIYDAQCVQTREKLVFVGCLFPNGDVIEAQDARLLINKSPPESAQNDDVELSPLETALLYYAAENPKRFKVESAFYTGDEAEALQHLVDLGLVQHDTPDMKLN